MSNVEFSDWLKSMVDFIGDEPFTYEQLEKINGYLSEVISSDARPLTLDEVIKQGLEYYVHDEGVYIYITVHGVTLVRHGKILCKDVEYCHWYDDDTCKFKTKNGWTMMNGDTILCQDAKDCGLCSDAYWYKTYDGEEFTKYI